MIADQAAALAERGLWLFPCAGKQPVTKNGFHDAVGTPDEVSALFASHRHATGIGVDCGRSGLLVTDLDGPHGETGWTSLLLKNGIVETLEIGTARGRQLWFWSRDPRSRNSAGKLGKEIDTRGRGGYVLAPPSLHPSGTRYRWLNRRPIADAPEWLLEALELGPPATPVGERREIRPGERVTPYGRAALEGLADDVLRAVEGTRNATFNAAAWRAGRLEAAGELDEHLAEDVLTQAAATVGLTRAEIELTWTSGFESGRQSPAAKAQR